jgi:DNA-binding HxlR family transcriptional regulator
MVPDHDDRSDSINAVAGEGSTDSRRIYRHFCMMARALEVVGERWSLLIVRDLLFGPRRFTDLSRSLAEITPTRLSGRLRQLEAAGIVARESPVAGREVWYRLTEAGGALGPAVDALTLWGIEHARERPRRDEPAHPVPVMLGTKAWLGRYAGTLRRRVVWVWRFPAAESYSLRFEHGAWALSRGELDDAGVTVDTSPERWARLLTTPRGSRRLTRDIRLLGEPAAIAEFADAFAASLRR